MRRRIWIGVIFLLGLAVIASLPFVRRPHRHIEAKAYFQNAAGLKLGAAVKIAGIDVGRVTGISIKPKLRDNPVEVAMELEPEYASDVPADSTTYLSAEGVLGPTFVDIDIRRTSGPPLQNGATLKAISVEPLTPKEILDRMSEAVKENRSPDNQH